jgi:CRP/FNR family transcriptional regulator
MKGMVIQDFISKVPLFEGLIDEQVQWLAEIVEVKKYARGKVIFTEGEEATGLHILRIGRIKIYKLSTEGKEQILHIFGPGEPFGEVAVFAGSQFPAYAEALDSSETLFFPRKKFIELITKDPSLAMNMLAMLSKRLKYFTQLVENLSLKEVPQRLAAYLLVLGNTKDRDGTVELDIAKGQLASLLGTIPETLSRILNKMTGQGYIEVDGRQIKLLDRQSLESISMGEKLLV